jgi:hypothetical protein
MMEQQASMSWQEFHHVTGLLVDITLLLAAVGAVIKFRLLNVLGYRWRSELACTHWDLRDGSVVFTADYTLHNTGPRALHLRKATLRLLNATTDGMLLVPDEARVLAERTLVSNDPTLQGIFDLESGERTIFTLRCKLADLPEAVFVLCTFDLKQRLPAVYRGFYAKASAHSGRAEAM